MRHQAFRYEFTMRELFFFLFGAKKCPDCGCALEKMKGFQTKDGSEFGPRTEVAFSKTVKVKQYHYSYRCTHCGNEYTLKELADRK